ncbi:hypothetical protein C1645_836649 [Glomus cerebriforme]|uniref:Uncharacterized protein n=1 Tax=Glomus cerebriforme TaxID=658196 RepID=A0A397S9Y6_9GLOM|nr:hypothetical protein C1645_836649 [Glomus cerebriforme]
MDYSKESSSSYTSNDSFTSIQSNVSESTRYELRNSSISPLVASNNNVPINKFVVLSPYTEKEPELIKSYNQSNNNNFPVNKVMVLSPHTEKEPELIGSYNKVMLDKDKGKKREHIVKKDFRNISTSTSLNIKKTGVENRNRLGFNKNKGKGKEREHIAEKDFRATFPFTFSNTTQTDGRFDIPVPTTRIPNQFTPTNIRPMVNQEPGYFDCIERNRNFHPIYSPPDFNGMQKNDYFPGLTSNFSNQFTNIRPMVNQGPDCFGCMEKMNDFYPICSCPMCFSNNLNGIQENYCIPEPITRISNQPTFSNFRPVVNHNPGYVERSDFRNIIPPTSLNSMQIPVPTTRTSKLSTPTKIRPVANPKSVKKQSSKPSSAGWVKKVIEFFNSYNYTSYIFDIVEDFSNKYQEIYQEDNVHLQPFSHNPCVLLEMLNRLLSDRLSQEKTDSKNFIKLEILAEEYYEKLTSAEKNRQGIYDFPIFNKKPKKIRIRSRNSNRSSKRSGVDQNSNSTAQSHNSPLSSKRSRVSYQNSDSYNSPISSKGSTTDQNSPISSKRSRVSDQNSDSHNSPISSKGSTVDQNSSFTAQSPNSPISSKRSRVDQNLTSIPSKRTRVDQNFTTQPHKSPKCHCDLTLENPNRRSPVRTEGDRWDSLGCTKNQRSIITQLTSDFNLSASPPVSKQTFENQRSSDTSSHITPIPESSHSHLEKITYKNMMASAIHELAIANISYKNNRELSPYKMHKIMHEFDIKSVGRNYGSIKDYGEKVIEVFNEGGMDKILKNFEKGITSYINAQPNENRPYNFIKVTDMKMLVSSSLL